MFSRFDKHAEHVDISSDEEGQHKKGHNKLAQTLWGLLAVLALVWAAEFIAHATPPSGISFSAVGRASLPGFDVTREDEVLDWELELKAGYVTRPASRRLMPLPAAA